MESKIKGIIFDKDGTLFSYAKVWGPVVGKAGRTILKTMNTKRPKQIVLQELYELLGCDDKGNTYPSGVLFNHEKVIISFLRVLFFVIKNGIGIARFYLIQKELLLEPAKEIESTLSSMDFSKTIALFDALTKKGITIGIVTNDTLSSTKTCLECMKIERYVDFIRSKDSNCKRKPNSQAMKQFCAMYGLSPNEVCVVGDTPLDALFASKSKAGYIISVLTGSGNLKALKEISDVVYDDISSLFSDPVLFPMHS